MLSSIPGFYPPEFSSTHSQHSLTLIMQNQPEWRITFLLCAEFLWDLHLLFPSVCENTWSPKYGMLMQKTSLACTLYWYRGTGYLTCSNWHPHCELLSFLGEHPKPTYIVLILCKLIQSTWFSDYSRPGLKLNWLPQNDLLEASGKIPHNWINYFD